MQARLAEKILKTIFLWRRMLTVMLGFVVVVGGVGLILLFSNMRSESQSNTAPGRSDNMLQQELMVVRQDRQDSLTSTSLDDEGAVNESDSNKDIIPREMDSDIFSENREIREIDDTATLQNQTESSRYTVQRGDTLWGIAEAQMGSGYRYHELVRLNKLSDPSHIEVGQMLALAPASGADEPGQITEVAASINLEEGERAYSVVSGDSLWKIAGEEMSDPYLWTVLYERNRDVIGDNPDLIYPTTTLVLPQSPSSTPPDSNL